MNSYEAIFKEHEGLVSNKWIHYFYIYDMIFSRYQERGKPITFMEIGVGRGGSLEVWKKYFAEGSSINGVDINPKCGEIKYSDNIHIHLGSASDRSFMEKAFAGVEFDIILDDGSHICSDVIETFKFMFPKIKNGGLYVVEDLHTSYWKAWGGGSRKKGTSIEFFKNLVEALNSDYIIPVPIIDAIFKRFSKYLSTNFVRKVNEKLKKKVEKKYFGGHDYSKTIESITFYDSICVIKKYEKNKIDPFIDIVSGYEDIGATPCFNNKLELIRQVKELYTK